MRINIISSWDVIIQTWFIHIRTNDAPRQTHWPPKSCQAILSFTSPSNVNHIHIRTMNGIVVYLVQDILICQIVVGIHYPLVFGWDGKQSIEMSYVSTFTSTQVSFVSDNSYLVGIFIVVCLYYIQCSILGTIVNTHYVIILVCLFQY